MMDSDENGAKENAKIALSEDAKEKDAPVQDNGASGGGVDGESMTEEKRQEGGKSATGLPLLYKSVVPLNKDAHGKLKFAGLKDFSFSRMVHAVVLTAQEAPEAAMHYPIVFSGDLLYAVLGYKEGENLFVDQDGKWAEGVYVPAYVRRYPFILIETKENEEYVLAADMECGLFSEDGEGHALYVEGKPSPMALRALDFCMSFQKGLMATRKMVEQMRELGLLVDKRAKVSLSGRAEGEIVNFQIVDETVLKRLPNDRFLQIRQSGALDLIYAHLFSMRSWKNLVDAIQERETPNEY